MMETLLPSVPDRVIVLALIGWVIMILLGDVMLKALGTAPLALLRVL